MPYYVAAVYTSEKPDTKLIQEAMAPWNIYSPRFCVDVPLPDEEYEKLQSQYEAESTPGKPDFITWCEWHGYLYSAEKDGLYTVGNPNGIWAAMYAGSSHVISMLDDNSSKETDHMKNNSHLYDMSKILGAEEFYDKFIAKTTPLDERDKQLLTINMSDEDIDKIKNSMNRTKFALQYAHFRPLAFVKPNGGMHFALKDGEEAYAKAWNDWLESEEDAYVTIVTCFGG